MRVATSLEGVAHDTDATRQVIASYGSYAEAQRTVDRLSDAGFPVQHASIVGRDLRLVEEVTGRLTSARATAMGGASGAWFGLFVGSLIGLFLPVPEWLTVITAAIVIGAVSGAIFGFAAHAATRGERDFASASGIVAARYDVTVAEAHRDRAQQLLSPLG